MSRSKREPWWTCGYGGIYKKFAKRQANKRLRKLQLTIDYYHKLYKKYYCSYDICDFKIHDPENNKVRRK